LKGVPTHFELYPGTPIALSNVIHLFSDHVCAACAAGLVLIELQEQIVAADWIADRPGMAMHAGQPISFAMVWGKRLSRKMAGIATSRVHSGVLWLLPGPPVSMPGQPGGKTQSP
jgi:hypothetical protein